MSDVEHKATLRLCHADSVYVFHVLQWVESVESVDGSASSQCKLSFKMAASNRTVRDAHILLQYTCHDISL